MKQISLYIIRDILEVYVIKNPTCFSRWSFSIGYKSYANIIVEGNGRFKSIDLKNWDNLVCYSMEEASVKFKK